MKNATVFVVFLLNVAALSAQDSFQLAPPLLRYPSVFFTKTAKVELAFAEPNTQIRYTTNNQDPTEHDPIYTQPIVVKKNFTTVKAKVFSKTYLPSDVVQATFIKSGLPIQSIDCTLPNPKYAHSGKSVLIDNEGGIAALSSKTWLGFQSDTVEMILTLAKKQRVKSVLINLLQDFGSWIFLPEKIAAYQFDDKTKTFQVIENQLFDQTVETKSSLSTPSVLRLKKGIKTDKIKIQLHLVKRIPDWHAGKGNRSWIFMDEIKLY